jgi:hypothetical protein
MGIWLAMLIPMIASGILLTYYRSKCVWWEFLILFGVSPVVILLCSMGAESSMTNDTEYWGSYVVKANYYEAWDEEVSCQHPVYRTEYSTDSEGNTTSTEVYSHDEHAYDVDYNNEYWNMIGSQGSTFRISRSEFEQYAKRWKSRKFKDMHRDYHSIDGDAYVAKFNGEDKDLEPIVTKHTYENRIQSSSSVFNFPEVTEEDIGSYGLYKYPDGTLYNPSFIGNAIPNFSKGNRLMDIYNAKSGFHKEVRVWVLIFKNTGMETGIQQENLWKGGNKNEFVVCLSVDGDNKPQWSRSFTWCENDILKANVDSYVMGMATVDGVELSKYASAQVNKQFFRKEFGDFDYIEVQLPAWAYWTVYIITLLVNVGLSFFIVNNDVTESSENRRKKRRR